MDSKLQITTMIDEVNAAINNLHVLNADDLPDNTAVAIDQLIDAVTVLELVHYANSVKTTDVEVIMGINYISHEQAVTATLVDRTVRKIKALLTKNSRTLTADKLEDNS